MGRAFVLDELRDAGQKKVKGNYSVLCRPDREKSCFRCCPPIRPAGHDYIRSKTAAAHLLERNTRAWNRRDIPAEPVIDGGSCWGLGYLDDAGRLIGCLLHPACNSGNDCRDLTGYGDKCRRELCREARCFSGLSEADAAFVLDLAAGLDSFEYSSDSQNPVFRLLRWGGVVIRALRDSSGGAISRGAYREQWAVLDARLEPAEHAFPIEILLRRYTLGQIASPPFMTVYESVMTDFILEHRRVITPPLDNRPFVHQLGLPGQVARFLRSGLGMYRAKPAEAAGVVASLAERLGSLLI